MLIPLPDSTKLSSKQVDALIALVSRELDIREKESELNRYQMLQYDRDLKLKQIREAQVS